jgi:inner membrane protein
MDSLTQALLGATVQGAMLGRWQGRKALLYGAVLGSLPDLDVMIRYTDAVAAMTYHRGFSHSILVLSGLAALLTWLVRRWRPNPDYSMRRLFLSLWLVLATHPLLDCFTSYGTQLFWPLLTPPIAWSSIFIIDPLYTLPLLAAVAGALLFGLRGRPPRLPLAALALSSLYLATSLGGKFMAEQRVTEVLDREGIRPQAVFITPTPFNTLLWRVIVLDGEDYHEALVSWFDRKPPQLERIPRGTDLARRLRDSPQHVRLAWFTHGILRYDQIDQVLVVTDLRLGMTGFHPFRFILAERRDGRWQPVGEARRWPTSRGDLTRLRVLWQRTWHQDQPVPLSIWAGSLQR